MYVPVYTVLVDTHVCTYVCSRQMHTTIFTWRLTSSAIRVSNVRIGVMGFEDGAH